MKVANIRINGMENPVGFDFETVCVSWKVRETSARRQQNAKIEVSLKEDFSEILWDMSFVILQRDRKCDHDSYNKGRTSGKDFQ